MTGLGRLVVVLGAIAAACSTGIEAPPVGETDVVCAERFCIEYPAAWTVTDIGDSFATFAHPAAPDEVVASVGAVNMEGLVQAAGGTWPQTVDNVVRTFWSLADDGKAEVGEVRPLLDGSVSSSGVYQGGRLWFRLVPTSASRGLGIEVRAPNRTWGDHADVFLDGLVAAP